MVIHPSHLAIVNEAFTPSSAELDEWKGIVAAMEEAEREGLGAIRLNGRLIDVAHVHTARKELARAQTPRPRRLTPTPSLTCRHDERATSRRCAARRGRR